MNNIITTIIGIVWALTALIGLTYVFTKQYLRIHKESKKIDMEMFE